MSTGPAVRGWKAPKNHLPVNIDREIFGGHTGVCLAAKRKRDQGIGQGRSGARRREKFVRRIKSTREDTSR